MLTYDQTKMESTSAKAAPPCDLYVKNKCIKNRQKIIRKENKNQL